LDFNGKNIFRLKLKKAESQLKEKFSNVRDVSIGRYLPGRIVVKISERIPLAEVKVSDKRIGIDEYLKVFILPVDYRVLPKLSENMTIENKTACVKFLKEVSGLPIYKSITGVTALAPDDLIFFFEDNCKICMGLPEDIAYKVTYLEKVLTDLEMKGKKAEYINMRDFSKEHKEVVLRTK
jgi:cell division septal protein FtsQ